MSSCPGAPAQSGRRSTRGRSIELREELPGAAYATLYTGRRLADHGLYYPLQWSAAAQATLPWNELRAAEMKRHSVFSRLAAHGSRVLVLDPSECAPHSANGGVLVSGLQMRSRILLDRMVAARGRAA